MVASALMVGLAGLLPAACVQAPALARDLRPQVGLFSLNQARPWLEADAKMRADSRWLGADSAYSVPLGPERILWLFGDSFVAPKPTRNRTEARFVRNTLAIQDGADLARARVTFHTGGTPDAPDTFFASRQPHTWLWPGPGVRVGNGLLLFFMVLREDSGPLGFVTAGTVGWWIDNPDAPPAAWRHRELPIPANPWGVATGLGAVMVDGDDLVALSPVEPGNHAVHVARWALSDVRRGDLSQSRWSAGPVFAGGQTEFSLHRQGDRYVVVQTVGFGGASVAMRTAPKLEGPWSEPRTIYQPPESSRAKVLIYAAKAHPHLSRNDLVISYCSNSLDPVALMGNLDLYFPRFVRLPLD